MERYHLIAIINDRDLRITDLDKDMTKDFKYDAILGFIKSGQLTVSGLKVVNGELQGSNGSLDRYTHISNGSIRNLALVIIKRIDYSDGRREYVALNEKGVKKTISNEDAISLADKYGIANGKVVEKDGNKFLSSIIGEWDTEQIQCEVKKMDAGAIQKLGESSMDMTIKAQVNSAKLDTRSKFRERGADGFTVEEKLVYAINFLSNEDYVLYAIFTQLERQEMYGGDNTLAVDSRKFYFNSEYIMSLTREETAYAVMHETVHVLMKHVLRGKRHSNHELSNIAADIMVNTFIEQNYGTSQRKNEARGIKFKEGWIPAQDIDLTRESFETIYNDLLKDNQQQQQQNNNQQNNQQGDDKQDNQQNSGNGQQQNNQNNSNQNSNSNQQGDNSQQSDGQGGSDSSSGGQNNEQEQGCGTGAGNNNRDIKQNKKYVFRGKIIEGQSEDELRDESKGEGKSEAEIEQTLNSILKRAETVAKMRGKGSLAAFKEIELATAKNITWEKYLEKFLVENKKYYNTFSRPDRRFLSRGQTIPGRKLNDNDKLFGVKFCFDTSGSITDEELGQGFAQIIKIMKKYSVKGEVVFWDTTVQNVVPIEDKKQLMKAYKECKGGGGTDINCVFDFFNNRKAGKDVIKPSLLIIFTDAYFGNIKKEKVKNYKNKILWVLSDNWDKQSKRDMEAVGKIVEQK